MKQTSIGSHSTIPNLRSACKRLAITAVLLFVTSLLLSSCTRSTDDSDFIIIDSEDAPQHLPYRFVPYRLDRYPVKPITLDSTGRLGTYSIQNNWAPPDTSTAVVFRNFTTDKGRAINQVNFRTLEVWSDTAVDCDGDGTDELVATYMTGDTIWLEIASPHNKVAYKQRLVVGEDRNGNGHWEGFGSVSAILDINQDGAKEVFVGCYAGYDLYPRKLIAVDWAQDSILWEFNVAGGVYRLGSIYCGSDSLLFFGSASPANGATAGDLDDMHTYVICLDVAGKRKWIREVGGTLSRARPIAFDYLGDGTPDVLSDISVETPDSAIAEGLVVLNRYGKALDSISFHGIIEDFSSIVGRVDSESEILVSVQDNTLWILDCNLQVMKKYKYGKTLSGFSFQDILGLGENQFLVRISDGSLMLFSAEFEPLARLETGGVPTVVRPGGSETVVTVVNDAGTRFFTLEKSSSLRSLFLRYRNHLTVVGVTLLAALLTSLFYQRRTRANLVQIAKQRDELQAMHHELKETQARLIAAEKYAQAKDIAGGFAHEIRNALFPARSWLSKLKKSLREPVAQAEQISMSSEAVARAIEITNTISLYTKVEDRREVENVDFSAVLDEVVRANMSRIEDMGIEVRRSVQRGSMISLNREQLYLVLNNLMSNSLDALTKTDKSRIISISFDRNDDAAIVVFEDNGAGIAEMDLARVFDPFFTTKFSQGTGLGLAISERIVDMYGGSIDVRSQVGHGTTFTLTFRLSS